MPGKSVTVTEKETGKSVAFDYKGSLATYKIDGYRLELYSLSKDPSHMIDPKSSAWFTTHFFLTYDLRTGEVIEHLSHTLTKVSEERDLEDEDYTFEDDSWKHATFEFTTGQGLTFCTELCASWKTSYPPHAVSAIAPDGYMQGYSRIGVKRRGGSGAVSVRYLVKPALPSFAASGDYTIDGDEAAKATGSGYYNNAEEAFDSEVCLVSGASYDNAPGSLVGYDRQWSKEGFINGVYESDGTIIHSNSARWQILTWNNNDYADKYIYLRHSMLATDTNYAGTRWYGVYLTFDTGTKYNLTADGRAGVSNSIRKPATGTVNASGAALPAYTGQVLREVDTESASTELLRGAETVPFFVAISGWSVGPKDTTDCTTLYG